MIKTRLAVLCAAVALATVFSAAAFAKPNFSGNWKMNASETNFGQIPPPERLERKIAHEEPNIKFTTTQSGPQGDVTSEMAYTTDGKPAVNKTRAGEVTSVAKWDGDVLTVNSKREIQGVEITQSERWMLSEDGKRLTIENTINTPQGDFKLKLVMDKQ